MQCQEQRGTRLLARLKVEHIAVVWPSASRCRKDVRGLSPEDLRTMSLRARLLRSEPRLKDDNCGLRGAARGVGVEVLVELSPSAPQPLALFAVCCTAGDLPRTADEVYGHVGVRLEVEPPRRFGVAPAVHGHGDEVRAVFEVADYHGAGPARPPPDGGKAHRTPTAGLRSPQTQSATGPAVQAAMGDPEEPDEPAGRESYVRRVSVRHFDFRAVGLMCR